MNFTLFNDTENSSILTKLDSVDFHGRQITIRVLCPKGKQNWESLMLSYARKIESDREDYILSPVAVTQRGEFTELTCRVDIESFPFHSTNWQFRAVYEENGIKYAAPVTSKKQKRSAMQYLFRPQQYSTRDGHLVFQHIFRGGHCGLIYRKKTEGDSFSVRLRELIALRRYRCHPEQYDGRNTYLIFEKRCEKAQDNGYYLFKYCMDNNMEEYLGKPIYYVITGDAPDRRKLDPYKDHVLEFLSLPHMLALLSCRLLISPDSRNHAYIWQHNDSPLAAKIKKKPYVFLGHGVLALKKLNASFMAKKMNAVMTTVTSQQEAETVIHYLGFQRHEVVITGYSRFDALKDQSEGRNEILIMPTHRSWLFGVERDVFIASDYYQRYMKLINSPELIKVLRDNNMIANFYLHPSIKEHCDAFTSSDERVKIIAFGSCAVDELMMRCKLLVTDYSSVCWDVYYMGKPTIFYQYDLQDYLDTWGSYIDLEKDSPGRRATEHDQLIRLIKDAAGNGFRLDEEWTAKREAHYRYLDDRNSERICAALKERDI